MYVGKCDWVLGVFGERVDEFVFLAIGMGLDFLAMS